MSLPIAWKCTGNPEAATASHIGFRHGSDSGILSPPREISSPRTPPRHDVDKLIEQQSTRGDSARRKQILWQIERKLAEKDARPIIFYADGGTCMRPWVKGQVVMVNSIFSGARREDVWLDK
jgi:hypothetical protein